MGTIYGAGSAYRSRALEFTHGFLGVSVAIFAVLIIDGDFLPNV